MSAATIQRYLEMRATKPQQMGVALIRGEDPLNRRNVQLSGPGKIRLVQALSRAMVTEFNQNDRSMYCDAVGNACMVVMHESDWGYFKRALQLDWVDEQPDLVLDESGLTWNMMCERGHAYQVCLDFEVRVWDAAPEEDL